MEADEEDDLCPGAFSNDEHRVVARPSTEFADDSLKVDRRVLSATRTVKLPWRFPQRRAPSSSRPSTEFADDSLIDESSLLPEQLETDVDTQSQAVDAGF
ncbi:hypothetical protein E4U50_003566 [Claviceps purpurea]|nr:hypothetical protein E4U50_003566 [Claviceps purpurea]